jgi:hypothetical protein
VASRTQTVNFAGKSGIRANADGSDIQILRERRPPASNAVVAIAFAR